MPEVGTLRFAHPTDRFHRITDRFHGIDLPCGRQLSSAHAETSRMTHIHDLTAQALSSAYRGKQLSPVEVAQAALPRMALWEPKLSAMVVVDGAGGLAPCATSH